MPMFDLKAYVEVKDLLDQVALIEDRLSANERELFRSLKAKYDEPGPGSFDDKVCLEVLLRNVEIRAGYGLTGRDAGTRRIDLPRQDDPEQD